LALLGAKTVEENIMGFKSILAAVALILAPLAANAVTIPTNGSANVVVGDVAIGSFTAPLASPVSFTVIADEAMRVNGQATELKVSGFAAPTELLYGRTGFEVAITPEFVGTNASYVLPSIQLAKGESVTTIFTFAGIDLGSGGQVSIETALVPLPAAGWMLISALGGMGILARRRKTV
jgi:hypothetical protein